MSIEIVMTLDELCKGVNTEDILKEVKDGNTIVDLVIQNEYGITSFEELKKWRNPKADVYVQDKDNPPKYFTKNGRPIYGKKRKYPQALSGREIVCLLKSAPQNVHFEFSTK